MNVKLGLVLCALFITLYWILLATTVDSVLAAPRLRRWHWLLVGAGHALLVLGSYAALGSVPLSYFVLIALMLASLFFFYRDRLASAALCTLACALHIISVFIFATAALSGVTNQPPFYLLSQPQPLLLITLITFAVLSALTCAFIKVMPLPMIKIINQHQDQQLFVVAWMAINCLFLIYVSSALLRADYPPHLSGLQVATAGVSLISLYIMLFFCFKTSIALGYKQKNETLEQAIALEQQYRISMLKDAVASYEINATQDTILKGFEALHHELGDAVYCYSDMLDLMARQLIHSDDVDRFVMEHSRDTVLRRFAEGETEFSCEYRRLLGGGAYIWVRAIANLVEHAETGDVKAFICIKNIDTEKRTQLDLQRKAERDPLTGLYHKGMTAKLVDEHLLLHQTSAGSALFMIDVDYFKEINDCLGHVYGDAVLCELADKLLQVFRNNDIVGRVGGDEFIVFLKDGAQKAAEKAAEICKAFQGSYQCADGGKCTISASIGISCSPTDGTTFRDLYSHADVALYEAKSAGKNTFCSFSGSSFAGYTSQRSEIQVTGNLSPKGFRKNRIEYVFKMLYESANCVAAIHAVLELVSRHFSFERGYIFETSKDGKTTDNTFEWCADGITAEIKNLQQVPIEAVATANASFQRDGTFILKTLDDLQPLERAVLEPQGIQSMFQFGIFDKTRLLGFIGFDNCQSTLIPSDTDIDEMKTICNILATFFVKQYIDDAAASDLRARQQVMNQLSNYIYVINAETFEVLFMNEKVQLLLAESEGMDTCHAFFRGEPTQCSDCPLRLLTSSGTNRIVTELFNQKLGIWMETAASFLRWTDGTPACLINCTDITEQKEAYLRHVDQLASLLYVDSLTGGSSYYKFKEDALGILAQPTNLTHLLVKLDIENFKLINQIYGYEKGDDILCCVTKSFQAVTRTPKEIFARVSNDEFIALFEVVDEAEADLLYQRFLTHFQGCINPEFTFKCNFPHGRYLLPHCDVGTMSITDMFERANVAHKAAKLDKTCAFTYYDVSMIRDALRTKEVEDRMASALANGEFSIYLQPKYHLVDERIGGAEALTRWNASNKDLFFPNAFIPVFEQNGFITTLDFYVFRAVCRTLRNWVDTGLTPVPISVNFSRLHLDNPTFVEELCNIVDEAGVDRHLLEIEITETVIYDHIEALQVLIQQLHANDFSLSMDDFGSGYSSLGMLKSLPFDVIKMDRSFFVNQHDAARSKTVVGSIIQMAAQLDIRIVAEGVEDVEHINLLRELHCDMVQGYYYARPMPTEEFTALLTAQVPIPRNTTMRSRRQR